MLLRSLTARLTPVRQAKSFTCRQAGLASPRRSTRRLKTTSPCAERDKGKRFYILRLITCQSIALELSRGRHRPLGQQSPQVQLKGATLSLSRVPPRLLSMRFLPFPRRHLLGRITSAGSPTQIAIWVACSR